MSQYNFLIASTYGSNPYGNNVYSAGQTQTQTGTGSSSSGGSLVNTGSAAILITVVAIVILLSAFIVSKRKNKG